MHAAAGFDPMLLHLSDDEKRDYITKVIEKKKKYGHDMEKYQRYLDLLNAGQTGDSELSADRSWVSELTWALDEIPEQYIKEFRRGRIPAGFKDQFMESLSEGIKEKFKDAFAKNRVPKEFLRELIPEKLSAKDAIRTPDGQQPRQEDEDEDEDPNAYRFDRVTIKTGRLLIQGFIPDSEKELLIKAAPDHREDIEKGKATKALWKKLLKAKSVKELEEQLKKVAKALKVEVKLEDGFVKEDKVAEGKAEKDEDDDSLNIKDPFFDDENDGEGVEMKLTTKSGYNIMNTAWSTAQSFVQGIVPDSEKAALIKFHPEHKEELEKGKLSRTLFKKLIGIDDEETLKKRLEQISKELKVEAKLVDEVLKETKKDDEDDEDFTNLDLDEGIEEDGGEADADEDMSKSKSGYNLMGVKMDVAKSLVQGIVPNSEKEALIKFHPEHKDELKKGKMSRTLFKKLIGIDDEDALKKDLEQIGKLLNVKINLVDEVVKEATKKEDEDFTKIENGNDDFETDDEGEDTTSKANYNLMGVPLKVGKSLVQGIVPDSEKAALIKFYPEHKDEVEEGKMSRALFKKLMGIEDEEAFKKQLEEISTKLKVEVKLVDEVVKEGDTKQVIEKDSEDAKPEGEYKLMKVSVKIAKSLLQGIVPDSEKSELLKFHPKHKDELEKGKMSRSLFKKLIKIEGEKEFQEKLDEISKSLDIEVKLVDKPKEAPKEEQTDDEELEEFTEDDVEAADGEDETLETSGKSGYNILATSMGVGKKVLQGLVPKSEKANLIKYYPEHRDELERGKITRTLFKKLVGVQDEEKLQQMLNRFSRQLGVTVNLVDEVKQPEPEIVEDWVGNARPGYDVSTLPMETVKLFVQGIVPDSEKEKLLKIYPEHRDEIKQGKATVVLLARLAGASVEEMKEDLPQIKKDMGIQDGGQVPDEGIADEDSDDDESDGEETEEPSKKKTKPAGNKDDPTLNDPFFDDEDETEKQSEKKTKQAENKDDPTADDPFFDDEADDKTDGTSSPKPSPLLQKLSDDTIKSLLSGIVPQDEKEKLSKLFPAHSDEIQKGEATVLLLSRIVGISETQMKNELPKVRKEMGIKVRDEL